MNANRKVVYITTPNIILRHNETFANYGKLDVMIIDEGHKAKNIHTKLRKSLKEMHIKRQKIILTGTPV